MMQSRKWWVAPAFALGLLFLSAGWGGRAIAQDNPAGGPEDNLPPQAVPEPRAQAPSAKPATVRGTVLDGNGRPFAMVDIIFKNTTTGQAVDALTDGQGRYTRSLPPGNYTVQLLQEKQVMYEENMVFSAGQTSNTDFDFRAIKAKEASDAAATEKANADAKAKFAAMKVHFDAGLTALQQEKDAKAQLDKSPKDAALQSQVDTAGAQAASELQQALEGTADTDPNRAVVLSRLGDALETDAKYADAADAYQKSVALKPDPGIYNNLGNCLARTGKVDDAKAAYTQAEMLDPMNKAMYLRNFAVGLYNSGQIKQSVEPLQEATTADPNSAQAWYLLGAALVNTMDFKQEGDKVVPVMQPGTVEAYQHAIQLDPNGPYGAQAKQGLEALQAMGLGIDTKLTQPSQSNNNKKK